MDDENFVELFRKDCEYYDKDRKEINSILSLVDFEPNDTLIDIGAGIGRLAIPLSKHLKVTAIDSNESLLSEIKEEDIEKINSRIENFSPEEKFDYALIAWPQFENQDEILRHIKNNILKENGKLIVIKSINHDLKRLAKILFPKIFNGLEDFLSVLNKSFNIDKEETIETQWIYPSEEAFNLTIFGIEAFFDQSITSEQEKVIRDFIKEREREGKVYMDAELKVLILTN